jgi:hypothetical protein
MFDQQGIWEMNRAHHQDLIKDSAKRRLLDQVRKRRPVLLEALRSVLGWPLPEANAAYRQARVLVE